MERPSEPGPGTIAGGGPGDSLTAVAPAAGTTDAPAPTTASVARQRWRLVLARDAGPEAVTGRELAVAWDDAIEETGLPVHRPAGRSRARIAFGAPVPAAMALERELADLVLTEFVPRWRVREALDGRLPGGWRLVDLYDVWPGAPALAGQVVAADYRFELEGQDPGAVAKAAAGLLGLGPPAARTAEGDRHGRVRPPAAARGRDDRLGRPTGRRSGADTLRSGPRHRSPGGGGRGPR